MPSDVGVRTELIAPCPPSDGAALFLIETDFISLIGPERISRFAEGTSDPSGRRTIGWKTLSLDLGPVLTHDNVPFEFSLDLPSIPIAQAVN